MKKIIALLWLTLLAMVSTVNVQADEAFRKHRYDSWKVMGLPENAIVFAGNSITDMHNWVEAFGNDQRIVNRGNSGGYSYEVLDNVESWVRFKPAKVFIKIGTNDLGTSYTEQSIAANIQKTVDIIRNESPDTKIYLQSILPAKDQAYKTLTTIQAANVLIRQIAEATANCTYIDLYSLLGGIRSGGSYSADNLHLKAYGYKIWCEAILQYLNEGNTGAPFSCVYPSNTETSQNMGGLGGSNGMRATYFSVQPITSNDILFFGDEMVKNGEWNELLHNPCILNRGTGWGYGGDIATTSGLVDATFASVSGVSKAAPNKILLYTGTADINDVNAGKKTMDAVKTAYADLIYKLHVNAPTTPIYLVSLMPTSGQNTSITAFNSWLQSKGDLDDRDYLHYIDIYTALASNGKANGNYFSGDYIYGMGYVKVAQELAKHIEGCPVLTEEQAAANKQVFEARTALNTAVNKAKSLRFGTGIGEYPQSVETALASAITTAYGVLANTDATVSALTSATSAFNSTLTAQLANINKPTTDKNYTIKASFSSGAKGRYLVNNNGTLSAYTYLPGGYSALWTYTGSGFKSAADPTQHLYVSGGFGLNTSTHTLDINVGLTEGTVAIAEATRNAAINKDGTVSGGQYTGKQCNENSGWTTDFVLEEVEGEIPAPEVSAPTFSAINLLNTQTGWYQIADYMNANSQATSDPALLTAYADEVTVNSNKYPAGFSVKKTATSVDELVKTFVYVTKTGSNNTNTNYINLQTANGRYMTYDGTSSLTASQICQIYFTGSQPTRIVMSSSNDGSNTRHSWIPQTSNATNYVGYVQGSYPSYQFSAVDLDALNLKTYKVKAVGTAEDVQVTYNGTDNYGLDKVYNNGVFFFGIDAYPTASDFSASVANATITVGDGVIYVDGVQSTKVFETPASGTPYRIPAVAQAKNGDLVFVSDYRYSKADIGLAKNGKLDLRFRKKYADGHWGNVQTLAACIESPTFTAFGDPCIVCDQTTGKIMVTSCCGNVSYPDGTHSNHQGWARWYSEDNGEHWSSTYVDLQEQVMNQVDQRTGAKLASFFIGSGKISQSKTVKVGEYYRLYCASLTRVSPDGTGTGAQTMNYVWYSDDFGVTWKMLGTADGNPINGGNEPKADELPDGSVLISSRTGGGRIYNIYHYTDTKAAKGYWGSQVNSNASNNGTFGADCNGEILVVPVTRASDSQKTYLLLQSIPAASDRRNVGIYYKELTDLSKYRTPAELAANDWSLFPISYTTSAYSTMCQMENNHIAFFYEENDHNSGYDMVFKEFSIETITGNAYSYGELTESEKNTYLTNGVDPYFNTHNYGDETITSLAAAYKTSPTTSNYDALNAAVQDYFNVNVAGEYIRLRNCNYNTYMNANGTGINGVSDGTGNGTLWYVEDNGEGGLMLKNVGTGTYMGNISQSAAVTLSADNTTTFEFEMLDNGHVVFKQQNGGNYQYGHIDASNKLVGWEKSAGATQWELIEVVEVPSSTLSLEPNSQVTVSELSALTITFKGSNAANVKLSGTQHTAYLTTKTAPAQVKAQNGKFNAPRLKAAGETPEGIPGEISATDEAGKFSIAFDKDAIEAGDYELSIPSGTFYVENDENLATPVPALTANYTVGEAPDPVDDINEVIAYGALDGNTWAAWKNGVEIPAGISAITQAGDATKLKIIEKTYSFNEGDNLSVIFKWDGVSNKRTDIVGVDILGPDGTVRYSDYHYGYAGNPNSNNGYTIKDIASGIYTVRYIATDNQSQTTTGGTITNVLWDVPVNGKVYTVNSDHMGVPYYLVAGTYEGFTAINGAADPKATASRWVAYGSNSEGYIFCNISTKENLHTNDGTRFDIKDARKLVGTTIVTHNTWNAQAATTQTLKGGRYGRSDEEGMKGILQNDKTSWSTDFVFNFTGEYAYKVQTEEGQTVTFNDVDFENGDFIIVDEQLTDATGFEASAKTGYKSEIAVDATNYTITVTYTVEDTPAEVPETDYYYIKAAGQYLYNDQSVGAVTQKSDSYAANFNNRYIWRITNDGNGTLTILNGEGKGYKASESSEEITSLGETDFLSLNWSVTPVELTSGYKWIDVVVRYADGMMTYTHGGNATQYVANGGFFALFKTNRSDGDISYTPVEGFKAASISDETRYEEVTDVKVSYYTQETEDKVHDMQVKIMDWIDHLNCVGYPTYETIFEDQYLEDYVQVSSSVIAGVDVPFSPGDYFDVEEAFNRMCAISDVIMPEIGDAYTLAVRSKNGSKHYLVEGGGLTTDKSQASVFVLGTSGNAGHDYLLATNDNEQSHYLQYKGATSKTYSANTCDIKFDAMVGVGTGSNAKVDASMIQRVGTFAIQTAARPDDAELVGTLTVKEDGSTWDKSKEPFMNDSFTSAIEMEVVDYPYTHPTLASGTGDGHEGVFASVWLPFPMNIPDGIEVYKGTQERDVKGEPYLGLTQVDPDTNSCYAAGGYILYSTTVPAGQTLVLPANSVPTDARVDEDAAFVGSTENPELYKHTDEWGDEIPGDAELWTAFKNAHTDSTPYVLANKSAGIGFYKYTGTTYPKGKAIWLKPATANDSEVVKLGFGDIITAIEALHGNTKNAEIFDLQGRRLDKVEKGKINVINGQKIMFK